MSKSQAVLALEAKIADIVRQMNEMDNLVIERGEDFTDEEQTKFDGLSEELTKADENLKKVLKREADVKRANELSQSLGDATDQNEGKPPKVDVKEQPIYREQGSEYDPLLDLYNWQVRGSGDAGQRIARHNEAYKDQYADVLRAAGSTDFGGLVIPEYALEEFADYAREGRPFLNTLRSRPLTRGTIKIAKVDGPASAAAQTAENTAFTTADLSTTELSLSASTVAGVAEVSQQSIDFAELETFSVFEELVSAYQTRLDYLALHGTGANGQPTGIFDDGSNWPEINGEVVSAYAEHWQIVNEAAASVRTLTFRNATHVLMSSNRWHALLSATDSEGRPMHGFVQTQPQNVGGQASRVNEQVNWFAGLPVVLDDNIIIPGEDDTFMAVYNAREQVLREQNGGMPVTIRVDQAKAAQGTVQFVARGYVIFSGERRPNSGAQIIDLTPPEYPTLAIS